MNLQDLPDMSDALKKVQQFDEKKKLDPVGKEDGDVDNDGDKDSSDEYLMKRRKAISKAMKKEAYTCLLYTSPSPRDKRQSRMPSAA